MKIVVEQYQSGGHGIKIEAEKPEEQKVLLDLSNGVRIVCFSYSPNNDPPTTLYLGKR